MSLPNFLPTEDKPRLIRDQGSTDARMPMQQDIARDLVIVGGGLAGCCAAITAARAGLKVALVQDRPVLGGNASSEVRLWILGATVHMGTNNRWAREGGVVGELMVENLYRNPGGNPLIFDALLLEWVVRENNIDLFLNTAVDGAEKSSPDRIAAATAFVLKIKSVIDLPPLNSWMHQVMECWPLRQEPRFAKVPRPKMNSANYLPLMRNLVTFLARPFIFIAKMLVGQPLCCP